MDKWGRVTAICLLSLLIPVIPFVVVGEMPGERWLSAVDSSAAQFAATGMLLLAGDIVLPVPSSIVGTLLGARLGWLPALLWIWAGLMLGHCLGYAIGRLWPQRLAQSMPQRPTAILLFLSRPVPVLAEAMTFMAGASRLPLRVFLPPCLVGNACYALGLALIGEHQLAQGLAGPGLALPMLLPVLFWLLWRHFIGSEGTWHHS